VRFDIRSAWISSPTQGSKKKNWLCTRYRVFPKEQTIDMTGIDPRHRLHHLSLLPSGPDEVHDRLLRGGRSG